MLRITFGMKHIRSYEDHVLRGLTDATIKILGTSTAAQLIDLLPSLDKLPEWIARWKKDGRKLHRELNALIMHRYDEAQLVVSGVVCLTTPETDCVIR